MIIPFSSWCERVCCALALTLPCSAFGATLTWDGSSGNWDTDANWSPDGAEPVSTDNAIIDSGAVDVTLDEVANELYVGHSTSVPATLNVQAGGRITNGASTIGYNSGTMGTAEVAGSGSAWNSESMVIGNSGAGSLHINSGGQVSSTVAILGRYFGSKGTTTITGNNSILHNSNLLIVGSLGEGTLSITASGQMSSTNVRIGYRNSSTGIATVSGSGSVWNNSGWLNVGDDATGSLIISGGGSVNNDLGYVGWFPNSTGIATVTGTDSIWTNSTALSVGRYGNGTLQIEEGGKVFSASGGIGISHSSTGTVRVTGIGSTWDISEGMGIGGRGDGVLVIESGGRVINTTGYIGHGRDQSGASGGSGVVTVSGVGSIWENSGSLYVGGYSNESLDPGSLKVLNNARADIGGTLKIWSTGDVTLDGGFIDAGVIDHTDGGTFNFIDGELTVDTFMGTLIQDGGVLAAGNSPGTTVVTDSYMLNAGSVEIEITGLLQGVEHDYYNIIENFTIVDGILNVSTANSFHPVLGQQYDIIDVGGNLSGTFAGLPEGSIVDVFNGIGVAITYQAGDGNDIALYAVPEPSTILTCFIGACVTGRMIRGH